MTPGESFERLLTELVKGLGVLLLIVTLLYGLYLIAPQVYVFFRLGQWEPQGFLTYAGKAFSWEWASHPQDWLGVHAILNWFNAAFAVTVIGLVGSSILLNFKEV